MGNMRTILDFHKGASWVNFCILAREKNGQKYCEIQFLEIMNDS